MSIISLKNVGVIATDPLFQNLNFTLGSGDRVGLIAGNGGGKTTLLNCIAGLDEPGSGEIVRSRGLQIGMVNQGVPTHLLDFTLVEAVCDALPEEIRDTDGWRAEVALDSFDTEQDLRQRPVRALSGGWQRLMLIARAWVNDPDLLLLDEPTNHLDLSKILQLENWLSETARTTPVIIASHDRDFLDATTNRTLFLRPEKSMYFPLPFSKARAALSEDDAAMGRKHVNDLKRAKKLRQNAAKLSNIGINSGSDLLTIKAKQLKERAAKIEGQATAAHVERSGEIRLTNSGTHAKVLMGIENLDVTTPNGDVLFNIGKVHIFQGDRIVVLGANGTGKTQLIKKLHQAIASPDSVKEIKVTPSLVLGYLDQDLSQFDLSDTPAELVSRYHSGDAQSRSMLASAGFALEKQSRPISELSFGQRTRLGLLVLRLIEPNFYLLDEPTNHVDIPAQERLETEILDHQATVILISHDRRLVRNIGTRYLQIVRKRLVEVEGPEAFFAEMGAQSG